MEDGSRDRGEKSGSPAYRSLLGDPCSAAPAQRPTLDEAAVRALIPDVRRNVVAGGIRLAKMLDDALGPEAKAPGQRR